MNIVRMGFVVACLLQLAGVSYAAGRALGINYTVGPSFILGDGDAQDAGTVEPGVGAGLQLRLTRNLDVQLAYDYLHADLRTQAITFNGVWYTAPGKTYGPFVGAGLGFGKPYSGEGWDHFSLKLSGGIERALTSDVSVAGLMSYQFVDGVSPIGSVHTWTPGVRLIYYFAQLAI